jgi:hypothetical protein
MKIIVHNNVKNFPLAENFFTIDAYHTSGVSRAKLYNMVKDAFSFYCSPFPSEEQLV